MRTPAGIVEFDIAFACRQATDVVPVPGGVAVRHRDFPASYNNNRILVREAVDAAELLAAADDVLSDLDYRVIVFLDDEPGLAFEQAAVDAGYGTHPLVVMRFHGDVPPEPTIRVESVDVNVMIESLRLEWREDEPELARTDVDQLAERVAERLKGADEVHLLGVVVDGRVVARADYYRQDGIAQIEYVSTLPRHQGRGYSTAIMHDALRRARDCDTVFLFADAEDWPQHWYGRLGFTPAGRFHEYLRS
jgi:ribosomal protein S18 acetylase RimI-like enzyme